MELLVTNRQEGRAVEKGNSKASCWLIVGCLIIGAVIAPPPASAQTATLVQTVDSSLWTPASPDPAGIVYVDTLNALLVADSEVNEMPIFTGDNVFQTDLVGTLQQSLTTIGITAEPTGVTYDLSGQRLFISEDNSPKRIYEVDLGPDGLFNTGDDIVSSFSTSAYGSSDAEGVTYNSTLGVLHSVDGVNSEVYTIQPGLNGIFDGVAPQGDDIVTSFDTSIIGVTDPEGIAYDQDFGHLYIVGRPRTQIAHLTTQGALIRMIDISVTNAIKPAGLAYAPSSLGGGGNNLYVVDRGVDNNSDPDENDGKIYELMLPPFSGNAVPAVSILTPDTSSNFVTGDVITFTGTATDPEDGDISAQLNWNSSLDGALGQGQQLLTSVLTVGVHLITAAATDSGGIDATDAIVLEVTATANTPPTVTIFTPAPGTEYVVSDSISFTGSAVDIEDGDLSAGLLWASDLSGPLGSGVVLTTLSEGTHAITASVVDSFGLTAEDTVVIFVGADTEDSISLDVQVAASEDDAEEKSSGNVNLRSSDLELVFDSGGDQVVGMRFNQVFVPQGAGILDAYIQFQADETNSVATDLIISGENSDNSVGFVGASNNISNRPTTQASVMWSPGPWNTVGEAGAAQRTPGLRQPVQEIVARPGWSPGNSIVMLISGTGERTAESYNGSAEAAPLLHIEYSTVNSPPSVDAGPDFSVNLAEMPDLDGFVLDDGVPAIPGMVTSTWTLAEGPAGVTFGDPTNLNTSVSFYAIGSYTLQLTADDGELESIDQLNITVNPSIGNNPPTVFAGNDATVTILDGILLEGVASDDGLPNPPGALDITWSKISGPGTVAFADQNAISTIADFSVVGAYVLGLSASDSEIQSNDLINVNVADSSGVATIDIQINQSSDDAEERATGNVSLNSSDLEMVVDNSTQIIGVRFSGVSIPQAATIVDAYIQFEVDEADSEATQLTLRGESADSAASFAKIKHNISVRLVTNAEVQWAPSEWQSRGDAGVAQRTPNISTIMQELVDRPGWLSGNPLAIIITGSGKRVARSFNGSVAAAPRLHIVYQTGF